MQDRYVPDLGDFSKFGVIDQLCRPGRDGGLRTALLWCLNEPTAAELKGNDGRHKDYLRPNDDEPDARFRDCAPDVYDTLREILQQHGDGCRVHHYEEHRLFDGALAYYENLLGKADDKAGGRVTRRTEWLAGGIAFVEDMDIVFLDPDNGLSTATFGPGARNASKYVTPQECASFFDRESRSLILYQHAHRGGTFASQIDTALGRLAEALGVTRRDCFALKFRTVSARAYLVVPAKLHRELLRERAEAMVAGPWGDYRHFELH